MNTWMIYSICCFLPFCGWSQTSSLPNELGIIEEQIQALQERLHQERLKEANEEVEGQEYAIANWEAYAQQLERVRQQEEKDRQIQMQIKKLEERKAQLIQEQTQTK